jgi:Amt family ammonium transporter
MKLGYDDSLDAFGVHGVGGFVGCLLTGVFATRLINSGLKTAGGKAAMLGAIDGNPRQILNQAMGAIIGIAFGLIGTFVALKVTELITPVRIGAQEEADGMDIALHGEEAYSVED